jgi:uncharacterized membrane protein
MRTGRLEAFSDGVIAIIITIMVLELRPPTGTTWAALRPLVPTFLSYVLSFVYVGIYWNNHHHMLQVVDRVDGRILWANLHLLFWLSLVPFGTGWMGNSGWAPVPTASYGVVLLMASIAYRMLERTIIAREGADSTLRAAVGAARKEQISTAGYVVAITLAGVAAAASLAIYVAVAALWFVPDRRIERSLAGR